MGNTINMLNTGEVANVAFGILKDIQFNGANREILDNLVIPNNRVILNDTQKRAEELRHTNYCKIAGPEFTGNRKAKNDYYVICNENHRLYGKGVVMGMTSNEKGREAVPFYINSHLLNDPTITNNKWYLNSSGYIIGAGGTLLHRYVTGYNYVHHINAIRTDNYVENLNESNQYSNMQDKIDTSFGISGVSVGYNMNKSNGIGTLWRVTCNGENKGFSEYLIAAADKYLWHMQVYGQAYKLDDFNQSKFILNAVKYTGLRYDVAMRLAELVIQLSYCNNIDDMFTLTSNIGLELTEGISDIRLINEKTLLKYFRDNGMAYGRDYYIQELARLVRKNSTYKKK